MLGLPIDASALAEAASLKGLDRVTVTGTVVYSRSFFGGNPPKKTQITIEKEISGKSPKKVARRNVPLQVLSSSVFFYALTKSSLKAKKLLESNDLVRARSRTGSFGAGMRVEVRTSVDLDDAFETALLPALQQPLAGRLARKSNPELPVVGFSRSDTAEIVADNPEELFSDVANSMPQIDPADVFKTQKHLEFDDIVCIEVTVRAENTRKIPRGKIQLVAVVDELISNRFITDEAAFNEDGFVTLVLKVEVRDLEKMYTGDGGALGLFLNDEVPGKKVVGLTKGDVFKTTVEITGVLPGDSP